METLTEEITTVTLNELVTDPQVDCDRVLVHENTAEIGRITQELQVRLSILKNLHKSGLSQNEIRSATASQGTIESFIRTKQLEGNKKLRDLVAAGIHLNADLPMELQSLQAILQQWANVRMPYRDGDKFQGLKFNGDTWEIDVDLLEKQFVRSSMRVYVSGEQLTELRTFARICSELMLAQFPGSIINSVPWLAARFDWNGNIVKPKWTYFNRGR